MAAQVKAGPKARRPQRPPVAPPEPEPERSGPLHFAAPDKDAERVDDEREALFYVGNAEYTIPVDPGPGIGLEARHIVVAGGPTGAAQAEDFVMTRMLGEDGWADMRRYVLDKVIGREDFGYLIKVVTEKAMGALEVPNS